MLDHHIQKSILFRLAFADAVTFTELKPDDLDNKLFTYHLKKVIIAGFVEKTADGTYRLTAKGRRVGKGALERDDRFIDRAYSVLLLAVRRPEDQTWLLHTRDSQPLRGLTGLLQARPQSDSHLSSIAADELLSHTGLVGDFSVIGQAFFTYMRGEQLESFIHATILLCNDPTGEFHANEGEGEYAWTPTADFSAPSVLPTVTAVADMIDSGLSFVEQTFSLESLDSVVE